LAKTDPRVHLGQASVSWSMFYKSIRGFCNLKKFDSQANKTRELAFHLYELLTVFDIIVHFNVLRNFRSSRTLIDIIRFRAHSEATDPRDKIYGILGLQQSSVHDMVVIPNYGKPAREVFIDVAKVLIETDPSQLYYNFPLCPLREEDSAQFHGVSGLPTWAVDFTLSSHGSWGTHRYHRPENVVPLDLSTYQRHDSISHVDLNNALHTIRVYVGTIVETSRDLLFGKPGNIIDVLKYVREFVLEPNKILLVDLFETLIHYNRTLPIENDETIGESSTLVKNGSGPGLSLVHKLIFLLYHNTRNDILFVTSEGHLEFSYHPDAINGIRLGDVVVGLFSSNLPFVLRQSQSDKDYKMVNIAYLGRHAYSHPAIEDAPGGTTDEDIRNNLNQFGVREYIIT
jgi:hypothetical protein